MSTHSPIRYDWPYQPACFFFQY